MKTKDEILEEKWREVKSYYERTYKIVFKNRLPDAKIEFLHAEMVKLSDSLNHYFEQSRKAISRFTSPHYRDWQPNSDKPQ